MPSDDSERMNALSEAILRLLRRQEENERRLAGIEQALGLARPAPEVRPAPPPVTPRPPPPPSAPARSEIPRVERPRLETKVGLAWVNRIGAITLALGVAFGFKYASDNAWIGPGGRVALGVLAGLAALAAGDRTSRSGQKTYAQGIFGLGIAILYLSSYAMFGFYQLVAAGVAFVLMALVTAIAAGVSLRYDAPAIAALGLLGGYATPPLLSAGEDHPWVLCIWLLLLNCGAVAAAKIRKWRILEALALTGTTILFGGWLSDRFTPEKQTVAVLFALIYYALFALSDTPLVFYLSQLLAMLGMTAIWKGLLTPYAFVSLTLAAAGLAISDLRNRRAGARIVFASFWLAYFVFGTGDFRQTLAVFLYLTAAFVIFICWLPWRAIYSKAVFAAPDALVMALNGALYFGASYDLLQKDYRGWLGLFAIAVAAAYMVVAYVLRSNLAQEDRPVLLALGIALTFITLAIPIQFEGYNITMAWALEAAALVWIGNRAGSQRMIYAALVVLVLVFFRLEVVDSWMPAHTPFRNGRFLTFLIAAVAAWASAYWIQAGWRAAAVYLEGHFVMLWGLGLEAVGWVDLNVVEHQRSAESAAISMFMAVYAVIMIGAGVLYRSTINRIVGLGLIGLVVVKLYLYDVWLLERIYRIGAFGALGALLLLTSYVYSRNRASIENWWNDRKQG